MNLGCRSETSCTCLAENTGRKKSPKNSPSAYHRTTLWGYIFANNAHIDNRKKLLNSNISSTCPQNMVNFGLLAAEMFSLHILASSLQRRRSTEPNQTLHDVWPFPGLVHYIYIFRGSCPVTEFFQVQNSLGVQVLRSALCTALQ